MNIISDTAVNSARHPNSQTAATSAALPPPLPTRSPRPALPKQPQPASGFKNVAAKIAKVILALFGVFVVVSVVASVVHDVSAWASGSFALSAGTLFVIYSLIFND